MPSSTRKKILLITFIISGCGFLSELAGLAEGELANGLSQFTEVIYSIKSVQFSILRISFFDSYNIDSGLSVNYITLTFHFTFLLGGILYARYGDKETRLLRFSFASLLLVNVLALGGTIMFYFSDYDYKTWSVLFRVISLIKTLTLLFVSYWGLRVLNNLRTVELASIKEGQPDYVAARRGIRFIHLVIDLFLCLAIFSPFIHLFGISWLRQLGEATEERFAIVLLLIMWRFIYYVFFEGFFGATPAKMLTETRVVHADNESLGFSVIFSRTLSRFVPFEPFSFLGEMGWHDRWTRTRVVEEKHMGIPGSRYFWLIPTFIAAGVVGYIAHEAYDQYRYRQSLRLSHEADIAYIQAELRQLSENHLIELKDINNPYSSSTIFLKITSVSQDSAKALMLAVETSDYTNDWLRLNDAFLVQQEFLPIINIPKTAFEQLYTIDYDQHESEEQNQLILDQEGTKDVNTLQQFLIAGEHYRIKKIAMAEAPYLSGNGSASSNDNEISIGVENCGWAGVVKEIENIEGEIEWQSTPIQFEGKNHDYYYCPSFSFTGIGNPRSSYRFRFTVSDSHNRIQRFEVSGFHLNRTLRRLD